MTDYLTEQEQIEILKNWIKQYAPVILAGIIIALIAITGWRYWQERKLKILSHAATTYDEMLTAYLQNQPKNFEIQANKLFKRYSRTIYGEMAALMLAKDEIANKNYQAAITHFNWILSHSGEPVFRQIARLRLARLYIEQEMPQKSLTLLKKVDDKNFNGLINEIKGDAYLSLKNPTKAREFYKQALLDLPNADSMQPLLQMKYDNLAELT